MYKIKRYFQGVWKQAKMVRWPSRKDLTRYVAVVLGVVCFAAVCMVIGDFVVSKLLQTLDQAFPSGSEEATNYIETAKMIGKSLF
jgi:preprotein translocase SecE subunit